MRYQAICPPRDAPGAVISLSRYVRVDVAVTRDRKVRRRQVNVELQAETRGDERARGQMCA